MTLLWVAQRAGSAAVTGHPNKSAISPLAERFRTSTDDGGQPHQQLIKILSDFSNPLPDARRLFDHYAPLTSRAGMVIVIFAVGGGDHILRYRGRGYWHDTIDWARTTDFIPVSSKVLNYDLIYGILQSMREAADSAGVNLELFDLIDSGGEFTATNDFKYGVHAECTINKWGMFDVRAHLQEDNAIYASRPNGIAEGTSCGEFLADQVSRYVHDPGFDGILYGNQLGTRGRWFADDGPGYSDVEAAGIRSFLDYSHRVLEGKELMWSDSYNEVSIEHDTFSFPADAYQFFDYIVASGFCVIPPKSTNQYTADLLSKLELHGSAKILASLDYVDPWYSYNSITDFSDCSKRLERTAIETRSQIDGLWFLGNDEKGEFVPRATVESFALRYFSN